MIVEWPPAILEVSTRLWVSYPPSPLSVCFGARIENAPPALSAYPGHLGINQASFVDSRASAGLLLWLPYITQVFPVLTFYPFCCRGTLITSVTFLPDILPSTREVPAWRHTSNSACPASDLGSNVLLGVEILVLALLVAARPKLLPVMDALPMKKNVILASTIAFWLLMICPQLAK